MSHAQAEAYLAGDGAPLIGFEWPEWVEAAAAKQEQAEAEAAAAAAAAGDGARGASPPGRRPSVVSMEDDKAEAAAKALRRLHVHMSGDGAGGHAGLTVKAFKLLNLSAEWLRTYLPHCLAKIDRVSFGLLSMA